MTDGSVQVGVFSDANAAGWVNIDDFSLVQTGWRYDTDLVESGPTRR